MKAAERESERETETHDDKNGFNGVIERFINLREEERNEREMKSLRMGDLLRAFSSASPKRCRRGFEIG